MSELWSADKIKDFWENNTASFSGDIKAKEIVRLAKKHIGKNILDVGAGSGALMRLLWPRATGIDIAPKGDNILTGSIDKIPFNNSTFDTVFCTDILEHLPSEILEKGLQEAHRVLSLNGRLIATVPNCENLSENSVYCPCCSSSFHRWGHVQSFTKEQIFYKLRCAGFKKVKIMEMPLGLMAEHKLISVFWRLFLKVGFLKASDLFIVAEKKW